MKKNILILLISFSCYSQSGLVAKQNYSYKGNIDLDSAAFLTAANIPNDGTIYYSGTSQQITGAQMTTALKNLVISLKSNGLWTKIKAFYPFIGGTSASHKWNLKDPRDLDAAFRLVYVNTSTHNSLGFQPNGSNSYANTFLNLSTVFSSNAMAIGMYVNTETTITGDHHNIGAYSGSSNFFSFQDRGLYNFLQSNSNQIAFLDTNGFLCGSSTTTTHKTFSSSGITTALTTNGSLPTVNVWIGTLNLNGSYYQGVNAKICSVWFISGLTDTEVLTLETIVDSFETALHRNV